MAMGTLWYDSGAATWRQTQDLWAWNGSWTPIRELHIWDNSISGWRQIFQATPGPAVSISISPGSGLNINSGATQLYTFSAVDANGWPTTNYTAPVWSVTSITNSVSGGLVTAGGVLGGDTVTVTCGALNDSASFTVV
jgi:hypothetical protein